MGDDRALFAREVATGRLTELEHNAWTTAGSPRTWRRRVSAAVLSSGSGAAASHLTAARLWGMTTDEPRRIEVVSPARITPTGFKLRTSTSLASSQIVVEDGIARTVPARTILHCCASVPHLLREGTRRGILTPRALGRLTTRVGDRRVRGLKLARCLVEHYARCDGRTDSELESTFIDLLLAHGVPAPGSRSRSATPAAIE